MLKRFSLICTLLAVALCLQVFAAGTEHQRMNQKPAPTVTVQEMEELNLFECRALEIDCSSVQSGKPCTLDISLDNQPYTIDIVPKKIRADGFKVTIQVEDGSYHEVVPPAPMTFIGKVRGQPDSEVTASFIDGKMTAMILLSQVDSELFFIQPRPQASGYVEYNNFEVVLDPKWKDGHILNPELSEEEFEGGDAMPLGPPSGYYYLTEIAVDADYEFYGKNNYNLNTTIADIESVMNGMSTIYERDTEISWVITEIIVRTSEPDPYDKTGPTNLLSQFQNHWNQNHSNIQRDIAHLMTGKQIQGSTIGMGYVKVICSSGMGYAFSQSRFTQNYDQRVALTTHELGHNYGCNGHCDGDGDCHIMCSAINSCNGLGLPHFGPWAVTKIMDYAESRTCLDVTPATASVEINANMGYGEIVVDVSPPDVNNQGEGVIPFARKFTDGTTVTITAPEEYFVYTLLYRFLEWEFDGVPQTQGEEAVTFPIDFIKAEATYIPAQKCHILAAPLDHVDITVTPVDMDGINSGTTPMDVTYSTGQTITATAPAEVGNGTYTFHRWIVNNAKKPIGQTTVDIDVTIFLAPTAVAQYKYHADNIFMPTWLKALIPPDMFSFGP